MKYGKIIDFISSGLLFFTFPSNAQVMIEFGEKQIKGYTLTAGDEFDANQLNKDKWMNAYPWADHLYCSMDISVYTNDHATVRDGMLKLSASKSKIRKRAIPYEPDDFIIPCDIKPPAKNLMDFEYQSGMIFSKEKFTYGYYEMLFRADAGEGLWPAFWLFGADNQEIDIFEIGSKKTNAFHVDVHCKKGCKNYKRFLGLGRSNWGDYLETNADWSKDFHRVAIHWTPMGITWFIDGTPIAWWKGQFKEPLSLIANIAVTNKKGSFGGMVNESTRLPAEMEVDYIRIWQERTNLTLKPMRRLKDDADKNKNKGLKLLNKSRPEYKSGVIKKTTDKIFLYLQERKNLDIDVQSLRSTMYRLNITGKNGISKVIDLENGYQMISLADLPAGNYQLTIKSDEKECSLPVEMP